eukprot:6463971-Amphidinium_carterae.2
MGHIAVVIRACVDAMLPPLLGTLMQKLVSVPVLMVIWCVSFVVMLLVRQVSLRTAGIAAWGTLRAVAAGVSTDGKDILLAMAFCCSQVYGAIHETLRGLVHRDW